MGNYILHTYVYSWPTQYTDMYVTEKASFKVSFGSYMGSSAIASPLEPLLKISDLWLVRFRHHLMMTSEKFIKKPYFSKRNNNVRIWNDIIQRFYLF